MECFYLPLKTESKNFKEDANIPTDLMFERKSAELYFSLKIQHIMNTTHLSSISIV